MAKRKNTSRDRQMSKVKKDLSVLLTKTGDGTFYYDVNGAGELVRVVSLERTPRVQCTIPSSSNPQSSNHNHPLLFEQASSQNMH